MLLVVLALGWHNPCGALGSTKPSWPLATEIRCPWRNSKDQLAQLDQSELALLDLVWVAALAEALVEALGKALGRALVGS